MAELDRQQDKAVSDKPNTNSFRDSKGTASTSRSLNRASSKNIKRPTNAKSLSNSRSAPRIPTTRNPSPPTPTRQTTVKKPGTRAVRDSANRVSGKSKSRSITRPPSLSRGQNDVKINARSGSTRVVKAPNVSSQSTPPIDPDQLRKRLGIEKSDAPSMPTPRIIPPAPADEMVGDQSTIIAANGGEGLWKARQAIELYERGKVSKAMNLYQSGMAADPGLDAKVLYLSLSGYRSLVKGQPGKALKDLEEAVELLPQCQELDPLERADVQYRLADICEQTRNVVTGLEAIRACIDLLVDLEDTARLRKALAAKGRLHYLMRQYDRSYEAFEMALSCEGPEPEAWKLHHGIAKCYEKQGEKAKAKKAYEASRRSVMNKARDNFDKLVSNAGQGSLLIVGGGGKNKNETLTKSSSTKVATTSKAVDSTESEPDPEPVSKGPEPELRARIAESVRLKRPVVSEAYPRDEVLKAVENNASDAVVSTPTVPTPEVRRPTPVKPIKPPEIPKSSVGSFGKDFSKPSFSNADFKPISKPTAGQETVALPAYDVSAPSRTRLSKNSILLWSLGGVPGVIGLFLLGLYFGHSTNNLTQIDIEQQNKEKQKLIQAEKEKNQKLAEQLARSNQAMYSNLLNLQMQLARSQLKAQQTNEAANSISEARNSLKLLITEGKVKPEEVASKKTQIVKLARQIVNSGPWVWQATGAAEQNAIRQISISNDGQYLSSLDDKGRTSFFATCGGRELKFAADRKALFASGCWVVTGPTGAGVRMVGLSEKGGWSCIGLNDGQKEKVLANEIGQDIQNIALSASGARLITQFKNGSLQVWSLNTAQSLGPSFELKAPIKFFAFSADESHLILVDNKSSVLLTDLTGKVVSRQENKHSKPIQHFEVSQDNVFCLTASADGQVTFWRYESNDQPAVTEHSRHWVDAGSQDSFALWHGRGELRLACGQQNGEIQLLQCEKQEWSELTRLARQPAPVSELKFMPHGDSLVSGSGQKLRLWRVWSKPATSELPIGTLTIDSKLRDIRIIQGIVTYALLTFDDQTVAIKYWSDSAWKDLGGAISAAGKKSIQSLPTVAFDRQKVAWLRDSKHIDIWSLQGATRPATIAAEAELRALAFLGYSDRLLAATKTGALVIFDEAGTALPVTPVGSTVRGKVTRIITSSNGAAALIQYQSGSVRLWRAGSARTLETLVASSNSPVLAQFSPDGGIIAVRSSNTKLDLWQLSFDGKLTRLKKWDNLQPQFHFCFTPDSQSILVFQGRTMTAWEVESRDPWFHDELSFTTKVAAIVSGPRLVTLDRNNKLQLQNASFSVFSPRLFHAKPKQYMSALTSPLQQ